MNKKSVKIIDLTLTFLLLSSLIITSVYNKFSLVSAVLIVAIVCLYYFTGYMWDMYGIVTLKQNKEKFLTNLFILIFLALCFLGLFINDFI